MADIPIKWKKTEIFESVFNQAVADLPSDVRKIWDNEKTRGYVRLIHAGHDSVYGWVPGYDEKNPLVGNCLENLKKDIVSLKQEQKERSMMRRELEISFASIRTVKQFTERFPELVKYLPEEKKPIDNLPATTHMIDKLKEMGLKL